MPEGNVPQAPTERPASTQPSAPSRPDSAIPEAPLRDGEFSEEYHEIAAYLGIDLVTQPFLSYFIEELLREQLPVPWQSYKDPDTGRLFYYDPEYSISTFQHPCVYEADAFSKEHGFRFTTTEDAGGSSSSSALVMLEYYRLRYQNEAAEETRARLQELFELDADARRKGFEDLEKRQQEEERAIMEAQRAEWFEAVNDSARKIQGAWRGYYQRTSTHYVHDARVWNAIQAAVNIQKKMRTCLAKLRAKKVLQARRERMRHVAALKIQKCMLVRQRHIASHKQREDAANRIQTSYRARLGRTHAREVARLKASAEDAMVEEAVQAAAAQRIQASVKGRRTRIQLRVHERREMQPALHDWAASTVQAAFRGLLQRRRQRQRRRRGRGAWEHPTPEQENEAARKIQHLYLARVARRDVERRRAKQRLLREQRENAAAAVLQRNARAHLRYRDQQLRDVRQATLREAMPEDRGLRSAPTSKEIERELRKQEKPRTPSPRIVVRYRKAEAKPMDSVSVQCSPTPSEQGDDDDDGEVEGDGQSGGDDYASSPAQKSPQHRSPKLQAGQASAGMQTSSPFDQRADHHSPHTSLRPSPERYRNGQAGRRGSGTWYEHQAPSGSNIHPNFSATVPSEQIQGNYSADPMRQTIGARPNLPGQTPPHSHTGVSATSACRYCQLSESAAASPADSDDDQPAHGRDKRMVGRHVWAKPPLTLALRQTVRFGCRNCQVEFDNLMQTGNYWECAELLHQLALMAGAHGGPQADDLARDTSAQVAIFCTQYAELCLRADPAQPRMAALLLHKAEHITSANSEYPPRDRLPLRASVLDALSSLYCQRGRLAPAIAYSQRAIQIEQQAWREELLPVWGAHLAALLSLAGKHTQALDTLKQFLPLVSENVAKQLPAAKSPHKHRGRQQREAWECSAQGVCAVYHHNIAVELTYLGQCTEALQCIQQAVHLASDNLGEGSSLVRRLKQTRSDISAKHTSSPSRAEKAGSMFPKIPLHRSFVS